MHLHVPTLMVMGSFINICAGAALLLAWWQNRTIAALGVWGASDIVVGAGILFLALGNALQQPIWLMLGGSLLALGPGLMWKAARGLDAKSAPLLLALSGGAIVVAAKVIPGFLVVAMSLSLAAGALYALAAAATLWLERSERLPARWPIIVFMIIHATVLLTGVASVLTGSVHQGVAPPVMSPFGLIHFEANVFAIGTAVFILALVKERKEAASRLAASIDGLTGIANRTAFMESAGRIIKRCQQEALPVSAIIFDLDLFKRVNDTHGHGVGDEVLRKFCAVMTMALRPNDVFGRIGGEEFAVVMPGCVEAAYARAERIRANFAEECRLVGTRDLHATVSGGVSTTEHAEHSLDSLLDRADTALYRAKAAGRNRIEIADQPANETRSSNVLRVA